LSKVIKQGIGQPDAARQVRIGRVPGFAEEAAEESKVGRKAIYRSSPKEKGS